MMSEGRWAALGPLLAKSRHAHTLCCTWCPWLALESQSQTGAFSPA